MTNFPAFLPGQAQLAAAQRELPACNRISQHYGLCLTPQDMEALTRQRFAALKAAGRVEFGGGILKKLVYAFCDSPYLSPENYTDTLAELQALFYTFKGECRERLSDDELIHAMALLFNRRAQGSPEWLAGASPEMLADAAQDILPPGGPAWESEED